MPKTDRYLVLLGIIGILLSIRIGYQYALATLSHSMPKMCVVDPQSRLESTALPSAVPNFRVAAHRQTLLAVDLRRADLQMNTQLDTLSETLPILDKVLFVPKKFG